MVKVSIIMPVYNCEKYVGEAIESVLAQSFKDFEFIIIDDGSDDNTSQIIEEYDKTDNRIRILRNEQNLGVVKSLNIGLRQSVGEYIARIDADDIWLPEKLEKQIIYLEKNGDIGMLATSKLNIDADGKIRERDKYPKTYSYKDIRDNILKRNLFCHSSVIFSNNVLKKVGYYDETFINSEDYEYWMRVISATKVEMLEEPLVYYRISTDAISYRRLKQQRYYAMLAKLRGIKLLDKSWFNIVYILEDLGYILFPILVFRIYRKIKRKCGFNNIY
ncbi:MAG: hypothetical protein AMS27_10725 [Bacteroides sp. SM23_62_1]|nr:MAG: hypothetical protein AMS27_10725 [Bacteroides sp. SM23_62_1]